MTQWMRWTLASLVLALALHFSLQPAAASNPNSLVISNVRDNSFVVSWLTAASESASVQIVGGGTFDDERGAGYAGMTHYVTVKNLLPDTRYYFDLVSGGVRYDNQGAHYTVLTGPTLTPPTPDLIVGRVRHADGAPAFDAILVFTIQQEQSVSAPVSMLLTPQDQSFFHVNLSDSRAFQDPGRYFTYGGQTDTLTIQAVDARGIGTLRVQVSDPRLRSTDPNQTVVVELSSPGGPTPTLVQRLPTPTPLPAASPEQTGGLIVGIGAAALVLVGILVVSFLFVWRH